jgi:hypothetical protein
MSNAPSTLDPRPTTGSARQTIADLSSLADSAAETLRKPCQFAGFWSAVGLPLAYVPMLAGGLTAGEQSTFALLLAVHAFALVAGHGYRND